MAATKPKKPRGGDRTKHGGSIPKSDAFLPSVDTDVPGRLHAKLSGRKTVPKDTLIIAAAIKRRGPASARQQGICGSPAPPYVTGWRGCAIAGLDGTAPNHKPIPGDIHRVVINMWLSHTPQTYGFVYMLRKMLPNRREIDIKLRATLHRMRP